MLDTQNQDGQAIPGYFSVNDNCHTKGRKSSETKMGWMEDPTFTTPVHKVLFEIEIYELWCKGLQDHKIWGNGDQKAGPFESKYS